MVPRPSGWLSTKMQRNFQPSARPAMISPPMYSIENPEALAPLSSRMRAGFAPIDDARRVFRYNGITSACAISGGDGDVIEADSRAGVAGGGRTSAAGVGRLSFVEGGDLF